MAVAVRTAGAVIAPPFTWGKQMEENMCMPVPDAVEVEKPGVILLTPLLQEALRHGAKIVSVEENTSSGASKSPPSSGFITLLFNEDKAKVPHLHHIRPDKLFWALMVGREAERTKAFLRYFEKLGDRRVLLYNLADHALAKIIKPSDASRYFPEGRRRIKGKIFRRLGRWFNCPGLLLSLTFSPDKISREDAWKQVGKLRREFMNRVNRWRTRHGMSKAKYLSVIEAQPGTGYPHVHLVFPYLKMLAPIAWMTEQWGQAFNSVDCKVRDSLSPVSYVCKYISKLDGWSAQALSYIWGNRTRLYSMSRDYVMPDYSERRVAEWHFGAAESKESLLGGILLYRMKFHTILGAEGST